MMFEIGQIVKFKDAGGTAKVCRIDGDIVYVFDDFGFENAHDARELLPVVEWQVGAVERKDKRRENRPQLRSRLTDYLLTYILTNYLNPPKG